MKQSEVYRPRKEQEAILAMAMNWINSVPYKVSARWLFYMLLQDGIYSGKEDYRNLFNPLITKARKSFYKEWRPETLADESREALKRGGGYYNEASWLKEIGQSECVLDKWLYQDYYVEIWYEAKAMTSQFEYYTKYITLRPFGGDPSIPYKWEIAKEIEAICEYYEKDPIVLYFGDYDDKGLSIPESALGDIEEWCKYGIGYERIGLNKGDEIRYGIIENPERPGTYQWEALPDEIAGQIITKAIKPYVSQEMFDQVEQKEAEITNRFKKDWQRFVGK